MKRLLTLLAALVILPMTGRAQAQPAFRYTNPVIHMDFSDPDVCRVGEDYYLTASSFHFFPGLPVLHSRDLVNWEWTGAALTDYAEPLRPGEGVWAPAIRYHDGWFYIFVGDPDRGIFMVRAKDPAGPWEPPVWLVREKGFIDPCPLWDDDGKAWLSHGVAGSRAGVKSVLFVAPMAPDGTHLEGPSRMVYDGHATQPTIEGTKLYKRGTYYYLFAPAGGVATGWQTVLRSTCITGPWEERVVLAWAPGTVNGPHQGAWVDTPAGDHWFLHFQDKGAYGRIVHLQPLRWGEDGWPMIGEDPDGDGVGQPVAAAPMPVSGSFQAVPPAVKAAEGPWGLPLSWQYPSVPRATWQYALPEGGVRLFSVRDDSQAIGDCPHLLQQMFPAERFVVSAQLSFRPSPKRQPGAERGGFVVTGAGTAGLLLTDTPEGAALEWVEDAAAERLSLIPYQEVNQAFPYSSGNVPAVHYPPVLEASAWVRLEVRPRAVEGNVPDAECRFSWSPDGKRWTRVPGTFTARPGKWTGARFGFFCQRFFGSNDAGWLEVRQLEVKPEFAPLEGFLYDEKAVPAYTLPDPLAFSDGRRVKSVKDWEKRRRELLRLFRDEMYGSSPGRPEDQQFTIVDEDPSALGGKALRRSVKIAWGDEYLTLLLYLPKGRKSPVPAFLGVNFFGNHTVSEDPGIPLPDTLRYRRDFILEPRGSQAHRWPLETILERGYAVATFCCEDIAPDSPADARSRIRGRYPEETWGNLAAWAWGLSRAMDYLESAPEVGPVAVFGHSRMGKAALWAAATDERFALYISNASGCGGAALSRRRFGETLRRINTHYPYWFTERFHAYSDNEDALSFDQHEALALIAPRPLYLESATEDRWSDPHGEFLGLAAAAPVYRLYGLETLTEADEPQADTPVMKGPTGYHVRPGKHEILRYDWLRYLDFADRFLRP